MFFFFFNDTFSLIVRLSDFITMLFFGVCVYVFLPRFTGKA